MNIEQKLQEFIDERIGIALSNIEEKPSKAVLNARETAEYIGYSREWLSEQRKDKITTSKKVGKVTVRPVRKDTR